jgi:hypothetical protein
MKRSRVLEKLEALGIPTEELLWLIKVTPEPLNMSPDTKKRIRVHRDNTKRLATLIDKLKREYIETDPKIPFAVAGCMPGWIDMLKETKTLDPREAMEGLAKMFHEESVALSIFLRCYMKADFSMNPIVSFILRHNPAFNSWSLVAALLDGTGTDARDLRNEAARIRKVRASQ